MKAYQIITDRVVQLLEQGTIPWHKPWSGCTAGWPKNLASGKTYRGINVFMLHAAGFDAPWWLTFKQAKDRGGHVCKGEHGWPVVFWKWLDVEDKNDKTSETKAKHVPMLRYYTVFKVGQCEGVEASAPDAQSHPFDLGARAGQVRQRRHGCGLVTLEQVRVPIHRERDRRMAHDPLNHLRVDFRGRQPRTARVS